MNRLTPRLATRLPACLILCAALGALSLSPARAGSAINKCVDRAGQVTLTDQACDTGTVSSTVVVPGVATGAVQDLRASADDIQPAGRNAPPRVPRWTPANVPTTTVHAALSGDMATLKQARVKMLLQDGPPRTRLALLDR